jgi:purine catabolism regulator
VTQGDASLVAPTHRNGTIPFRRNWAVDESRVAAPRDDRSSWQERMGLTVEEALRLRGLAGTQVAAGSAGLGRVVRHMVVDDPADPLAAAGPDVLVVLGARLPQADPANCRALVERLDSMGTSALAFRQTEGPRPVPGEVLAEADRRGLPVLALPAGIRLDELVSEVLGAVVSKQSQALALSSRMDDEFMEVALTGGGLAEVAQRLAVMLEGTAVLGLGPDREVVTSAGPGRPDRRDAGRRARRRGPLPGRRHPARARPPRAARWDRRVRRRADHGR